MSNTHFKQSEDSWNTIADSFDETRHKPWGFVIDFIASLAPDCIIADIGCGNGRHLMKCIEKFQICIGFDISEKLLRITKNKINNCQNDISLIQGNLVYLPFKDDSFNAILYIAALHNIKQREYRISSLKEVNRVLKPNGKALLSVWSRQQDRFRDFLGKKHDSLSEKGDILVSWKKDNLNVSRFYHLYTKQEIAEDIVSAGLQIISIDEQQLSFGKNPDNYIAVVGKG
jgi:tRNA (uracil-5-)-methyltransferase TRM9